MENTSETTKVTPKFFFLSFGVLVSLIASVSSFLNLVFETLNHRLPDALNSMYAYGYNTYEYASMRSSLAMLLILFPVTVVLAYFWTRAFSKGLSRGDGIIKKWMLFLVVFLASIVVIADLVTLVQYFVSGEITTRFILKVVTALVVAGIAGGYCGIELSSTRAKAAVRLGVFAGATVLVVAAIWYAFTVMGSPALQRQLRMDDRRIGDLQSIQSAVITYWQQKEKIPTALSELANPLSGFSMPVDPEFETGASYEYHAKTDTSFELCATFSQPIPKGWREYSGGGVMPMVAYQDKAVSAIAPYPGVGMNESWDHQAGRTCFTRTIDPDIYPPFTKQ